MEIRFPRETDGDGDVDVAGDMDGIRHEDVDGALPSYNQNVDA